MSRLPSSAARSAVSYPESLRQQRTPAHLLAAAARERGARPALQDERRTLVYDELVAEVGRFQVALGERGVGPGEVVSLMLPNWWQAVAACHAIWGLGAVVNPVTPISRERELAAVLAAADPRVVVTAQEYRGLDYRALVRDGARASGWRGATLALAPDEGLGDGSPDAVLGGDPDDLSVLMFTSGTTGEPKGVLHSHRTLLVEAQSISDLFALNGDRVFMPSPLTHITGLLYGVLMPLLMGGDAVLLDRWDPEVARDRIEATGSTVCVGATPFLSGLDAAYTAAGTPSALRAFVCGGADVPPALIRRATESLDAVVVRAYGLTEMPTVTCGSPRDTLEHRASTDGRPTGSSRVRIRGGGDRGELEARGPELCLGYLSPAHTAEAFDDGWFRTGDLAHIDEDGYVTILGRLKDIIVRAGENLPVAEIEGLLAEHPRIAAVAVVGIADDAVGERACACIVTTDGAAVTLGEIAEHLDAYGISRQKYPEHLVVLDALPLTASGKVRKNVLRERAAASIAAGHAQSRR